MIRPSDGLQAKGTCPTCIDANVTRRIAVLDYWAEIGFTSVKLDSERCSVPASRTEQEYRGFESLIVAGKVVYEHRIGVCKESVRIGPFPRGNTRACAGGRIAYRIAPDTIVASIGLNRGRGKVREI